MPRIRTVKPEFFRHEQLQELERTHHGAYPMLVFEGLWTLADKLGQFEWKPRQIHLDVLPYIPFEMEDTLILLVSAGLIRQYEVAGKGYGLIPTFQDHQHIAGKEKYLPSRCPSPSQEPVKLRLIPGEPMVNVR